MGGAPSCRGPRRRLAVHAVPLRRPGREHRPEEQRPLEAGHRGGQRHGLRRRVLHARRGRHHHRRRARDVLRPARDLRHGRVVRVDAHAVEDAARRSPAHAAARLARAAVGAARAYEIGLVSEVVPAAELRERAGWVARVIADRPPLAIQATLRATWAAHELSRSQALALGYAYIGLGTSQESIARGPGGVRLRAARGVEVAVSTGRALPRVAIVGAALSDCGRVDTLTAFDLHFQATTRALADAGSDPRRRRRLLLDRHGHARAGRGRGVPRAASDVRRLHRRRRRHLGGHGRARRRRDPGRARQDDRHRLRVDRARRPEEAAAYGEPRVLRARPVAVRGAVGAHADREVRDDGAPAHVRVRHDDRAARQHRRRHALQREPQPGRVLPGPHHRRRRA